MTKYSLEERLEIGQKIYVGEITRYEASHQYGVSMNTARNHMRLYRDKNNLPPKRGGVPKMSLSAHETETLIVADGLKEYESMTKEELIRELVKARITEERLKKGYEVKGDGTVILYDKENMK